MIFPLSDDDRHLTGPGKVTLALIILNVILFGYQAINPEFTSGWSVIPKEMMTGVDLVDDQIVEGPGGQMVKVPQEPGPGFIYFTAISAMFMHGGSLTWVAICSIFGSLGIMWSTGLAR